MINLRLVVDNGNIHEINLPNDATLGDLRMAVWNETGIPWTSGFRSQILYHRHKELPSDLGLQYKKLSSDQIGVHSGDVIQAIERPREDDVSKIYISSQCGMEEAIRRLIEDGKDDRLDWTHPYFRSSAVGESARNLTLRILEDLMGVGSSVTVPIDYLDNLVFRISKGSQKAIDIVDALESGGIDWRTSLKQSPIHGINDISHFLYP